MPGELACAHDALAGGFDEMRAACAPVQIVRRTQNPHHDLEMESTLRMSVTATPRQKTVAVLTARAWPHRRTRSPSGLTLGRHEGPMRIRAALRAFVAGYAV